MVRPDDRPTASASQHVLEPAPQMRIVAEARRRRTRRLALGGLLLAALVIAATVGTLWIDYSSDQRSVASRTSGDEALRSALATSTAGSAGDGLLVVLRSSVTPSAPPTAVLFRVSDRTSSVWALVFPADATLGAPGSDAGTVGDVLAVSGRSGLVQEVSKRTGRPVTAYLEVDPALLASSLEATGSASGVPPVEQVLSALRASGSASGIWDTTRMRMRFANALAPRAVSTIPLAELTKLAQLVDGAKRTEIATVPAVTVRGAQVIDETAMRVLVAQMYSGQAYSIAGTQRVEDVNPSEVTVTVWNGAGISGIAADAADRLSRAGYKVTVVTNANQFVYDTTLVVYRDGQEASAKRAALDLRAGRVVPRRGMYLFDTDLLVVVGKDWPEVR